MKKFLLRLLLLICIVIVADYIIGAGLSAMYNRVKSGTIYKQNYSLRSSNQDILLLGASEVCHHLISNTIKDSTGYSCYNCGIDGQNIYYQYALFKEISKRYTPRAIVLSFTTLDDNTSTFKSLLPYAHEYSSIKEVIVDNLPEEKYKLLCRTYPYNSLLLKIIQGNMMSEPQTNGYAPLTGTNPGIKPETNPPAINKSPQTLRYFKELITTAKKAGTKVFIFQAPRYQLNNNTEDQRLFDSLCTGYQVTPLNFLSDTTFLNHKEYFKDRGHLNSIGAQLLTNKVIAIMKTVL